MRFIVCSTKETLELYEGKRVKGVKPKEVECNIHWFIDSDSKNITLVKVRELVESEKPERANFEGFIVLDEWYHGKVNHAISTLLKNVIAGTELKCEMDVLKKISKVFDDLSGNVEFGKLVEEFKRDAR